MFCLLIPPSLQNRAREQGPFWRRELCLRNPQSRMLVWRKARTCRSWCREEQGSEERIYFDGALRYPHPKDHSFGLRWRSLPSDTHGSHRAHSSLWIFHGWSFGTLKRFLLGCRPLRSGVLDYSSLLPGILFSTDFCSISVLLTAVASALNHKQRYLQMIEQHISHSFVTSSLFPDISHSHCRS